MAKKKIQEDDINEEIISSEEKINSFPVSDNKDFVLVPYSDAFRLQSMHRWGMGRRFRKIVTAHRTKHGMVDLTNIEQNKPKSREQIQKELKERDLKKEIQLKKGDIQKLEEQLPK